MRPRRAHAWIGLVLVLALAWWIQPAGAITVITSNMPALPLSVPNGGTGATTITGLVLGNGTSAMSAYGGTSCTNQFQRSLSAAGVATCATVDVPSGGTGVGTFTLNGVLYGNSTTSVLVTAQGAANTVLTANAGAPVFSSTPTMGWLRVVSANPTVLASNLTLDQASTTTSRIIAWGPDGSTNGTYTIDSIRSDGTNRLVGIIQTTAASNVGLGVVPVADARLQVAGHIHSSGGVAPTVGTCGTSPSIAGTDQAGIATVGTGGPTACTVTFGTAWATAPICVASPNTEVAGITLQISAISTTVLTINCSAACNTVGIRYICMGRG